MEVDHVRHDGGSEDARPEKHAFGSVEPWRDEPRHDARDRWPGEHDLEREGGHDHADEAGDDGLEAAEASRLDRQDSERGERGDEPGREQRTAPKEKAKSD